MSELLQYNYWFNVFGSRFSIISFWSLLIIFVLAGAAGLILIYIRQKKCKHNGLLKKITTIILHWLNSLAFVGLLLFVFRYLQIPYFGMRIWLAIWLVICFIWLLVIIKYLIIEVPKRKKAFIIEQELKKYQP
jgi:cell division protein FtsW (lipid II flippase)